MTDKPDSPSKANLREVVNKIRNSGPSYPTMTTKQLLYLRQTAKAWLDKHPDNQEGLKRYDLLIEEIDRRKLIS